MRTNSLCSRSVHKGKTWQNNSPWFLSSSRPKSELPSCQSEDYLKALGVTYHFLSKPLIEMAKCHLDPKKPSICHSASAAKLCSWSDMNCNWLGVRWRVCSCLFPTSIIIHLGLHEVRATHVLRISWSFASEVRFVQGWSEECCNLTKKLHREICTECENAKGSD